MRWSATAAANRRWGGACSDHYQQGSGAGDDMRLLDLRDGRKRQPGGRAAHPDLAVDQDEREPAAARSVRVDVDCGATDFAALA